MTARCRHQGFCAGCDFFWQDWVRCSDSAVGDCLQSCETRSDDHAASSTSSTALKRSSLVIVSNRSLANRASSTPMARAAVRNAISAVIVASPTRLQFYDSSAGIPLAVQATAYRSVRSGNSYHCSIVISDGALKAALSSRQSPILLAITRSVLGSLPTVTWLTSV